MGVQGLWQILHPAERHECRSEFFLDAFNADPDVYRGLRLGIDASMWLFHARKGQDGRNPELRLLFYRLCGLLKDGVLPLFIFDGPHRPSQKRGNHVSTYHHSRFEGDFQKLIEAFGFEWMTAHGEAEAELAVLNSCGGGSDGDGREGRDRKRQIDAALTDDGDAFLFGADVVLRNWGKELSGNKKDNLPEKEGKRDNPRSKDPDGGESSDEPSSTPLSASTRQPVDTRDLLKVYSWSHITSTLSITRYDLILVALLAGGDYLPKGSQRLGPPTVLAMAKLGYSYRLIDLVDRFGYELTKSDQLRRELHDWKVDLGDELRTNRSGKLSRKAPSAARSILESEWPDQTFLNALKNYTQPISSLHPPPNPRKPQLSYNPRYGPLWDRPPSLSWLASLASHYFGWPHDELMSTFRNNLWEGIMRRKLRDRATSGEDDDRLNEDRLVFWEPMPRDAGDVVESGKEVETGKSPKKGAKKAVLNRTGSKGQTTLNFQIQKKPSQISSSQEESSIPIPPPTLRLFKTIHSSKGPRSHLLYRVELSFAFCTCLSPSMASNSEKCSRCTDFVADTKEGLPAGDPNKEQYEKEREERRKEREEQRGIEGEDVSSRPRRPASEREKPEDPCRLWIPGDILLAAGGSCRDMVEDFEERERRKEEEKAQKERAKEERREAKLQKAASSASIGPSSGLAPKRPTNKKNPGIADENAAKKVETARTLDTYLVHNTSRASSREASQTKRSLTRTSSSLSSASSSSSYKTDDNSKPPARVHKSPKKKKNQNTAMGTSVRQQNDRFELGKTKPISSSKGVIEIMDSDGESLPDVADLFSPGVGGKKSADKGGHSGASSRPLTAIFKASKPSLTAGKLKEAKTNVIRESTPLSTTTRTAAKRDGGGKAKEAKVIIDLCTP